MFVQSQTRDSDIRCRKYSILFLWILCFLAVFLMLFPFFSVSLFAWSSNLKFNSNKQKSTKNQQEFFEDKQKTQITSESNFMVVIQCSILLFDVWILFEGWKFLSVWDNNYKNMTKVIGGSWFLLFKLNWITVPERVVFEVESKYKFVTGVEG